MVRGQYVYNSVWTPLTDQTHKLEDNKRGEYTMNNRLAIFEKRIHISREISIINLFSLMYGTMLMFIRLNNFDTRHLFPSFCCTTQHIFEPLRIYEPCFNTDKYGIYILNTTGCHKHICNHWLSKHKSTSLSFNFYCNHRPSYSYAPIIVNPHLPQVG